jgi:Cof subfamily protein (haloacid dehalogenase superfamily)
MKYRLIACDLDETLLNSDHHVCQRNVELIQKAKQQGVKFVPATGRLYHSVQSTLKELGLYDLENEYVLSANGAVLTENKNNRILQFKGLTFDKTKEIFEFGKNKDVCIAIYTLQNIYVYHLNENEKQRMMNQGIDYQLIDDQSFEDIQNDDIVKVLFETLDMAYLQSLEPMMKDIIEGEVALSYSSGRYMELNLLGVDKGQGLRDLAQLLDIPLVQTIAVGDNYNDQDMLEVAGLSVAAGNAVDEIKKICDYTTQADCNSGVVAELIEKFILSKE